MEKTGFLGIDVSKGYADFLLLDEEKQQLGKSYKLYDTAQDHKKLYKQLKLALHKFGLSTIICGVESTGGYENNWYNDLAQNGEVESIKVVRLNPMGVKHQGESKLTRTITDKVSAQLIAYQLIENKDALLSKPKPSIDQAQARRFYHYIRTLKKQKTALGNQLEKLLYNAFPELLTYAKGGYPIWLLLFLSKYEGRASGIIKNTNKLLKINNLSQSKVEAIQNKAKNSVGIDNELLSRSIRGLCSQILQLGQTIKEEKKYLENNYTSAAVELLSEIKGIGLYTAIGASMEIEDVNRFDGAQKMASFFGVHPVFKKSGDGQIKPRMSKKGSSSFRDLLYMGARNVVNHNDYFKEIYAKFRAKGMKDGDAIGVIMHKLTRVFYGMLKSQKAFDPEIDKANQNKTAIKELGQQTEEQIQAIQQELEIIKNAPCSNRAYKRKKAELEPQTSYDEVNTRSKIPPNANL